MRSCSLLRPHRPSPDHGAGRSNRRGVAPHVVGRRVVRVDVYDRRLRWPVPADLAERLRGVTIGRVDRRSKYLLFHAGEGALLVHLGMTGTLRACRLYNPDDALGQRGPGAQRLGSRS